MTTCTIVCVIYWQQKPITSVGNQLEHLSKFLIMHVNLLIYRLYYLFPEYYAYRRSFARNETRVISGGCLFAICKTVFCYMRHYFYRLDNYRQRKICINLYEDASSVSAAESTMQA